MRRYHRSKLHKKLGFRGEKSTEGIFQIQIQRGCRGSPESHRDHCSSREGVRRSGSGRWRTARGGTGTEAVVVAGRRAAEPGAPARGGDGVRRRQPPEPREAAVRGAGSWEARAAANGPAGAPHGPGGPRAAAAKRSRPGDRWQRLVGGGGIRTRPARADVLRRRRRGIFLGFREGIREFSRGVFK